MVTARLLSGARRSAFFFLRVRCSVRPLCRCFPERGGSPYFPRDSLPPGEPYASGFLFLSAILSLGRRVANFLTEIQGITLQIDFPDSSKSAP